jgi:hypothetical protein
MTIVLALIAAGLIAWVLAGTPGIGEAAPRHRPCGAGPAGASARDRAAADHPAWPPPTPTIGADEDGAACAGRGAGAGCGADAGAGARGAGADARGAVVIAAGRRRRGAEQEATPRSPPPEYIDGEPVNYDIVDDPSGADGGVGGPDRRAAATRYRAAASECGKTHGVAQHTEIGIKMLLQTDGRLTNLKPIDRDPIGDPAFKCIVGSGQAG